MSLHLDILLTAPVLGAEQFVSKQETAREQALAADTLRSSLRSGERRSKEVTTKIFECPVLAEVSSCGRLTRLPFVRAE